MANNNTNESPRVGRTNFLSFTWCIDEFENKMKMEIGKKIESEVFSGWSLYMYPNGKDEEFKGYVGLYLKRSGKYNLPVSTEVRFSIVDEGGKKAHLKKIVVTPLHSRTVCDERQWGMGLDIFVPHSLLVKFQDSSLSLLPDNSLTILCEISIAGGSGEPYKGGSEREVAVKTALMTRLSSDMRSIMGDKFADLEIVCGGQKFPCHKSVLASRSSVFYAMFSHDMEENRRGRVVIFDLDGDTVLNMLFYIYSGHVDGLKDKATGLLAAADKYDLKELKQACEVNLSENIDKDNVLDMVVLADLHRAGMVRDIALNFIERNGKEIVTQPDWSDKLEGHPHILKEMFEVAMKNK